MASPSAAPSAWWMTTLSVLVCASAFIPVPPFIRTALAALLFLALMALIVLSTRSNAAETPSGRATPSSRTSS